MPFVPVESPVYVTCGGVEVRNCYTDDIADNPPLEFWYEVGGEQFDIRDLPVGSQADRNTASQHHGRLLRDAITTGILTSDGVDWQALALAAAGTSRT